MGEGTFPKGDSLLLSRLLVPQGSNARKMGGDSSWDFSLMQLNCSFKLLSQFWGIAFYYVVCVYFSMTSTVMDEYTVRKWIEVIVEGHLR